MRLRAALGLLALLTLPACNVVVTKAPLFTADDEQGAPPMRPGVWAFQDSECANDESKPLVQWADCAGGGVVEAGRITGHDTKDGKDKWDVVPFVLAAGRPRIAQVMFQEAGAGPGGSAAPYGYAAVRPTAFDGQGRITAVTYWLVLCGPPPKPAKDPRRIALGTRHPLPGMIMKPGDPVCTTTSRQALLGAARASEAWKDKPMNAHWVREAGAGDRAP
ncbi:MAG TPA: hypothetical protein VG939_12540 [Caulobacteraceae bacterium]|nr:hypothetical protein [Caulobacteraceae bacterium]